jgi:hypothetical protein
MDAGTRSWFEQGFGHDFGKVRVFTDAAAGRSAHEFGAQAYTVGGDIVFGDGQYAPDTSAGRALLAHELAHVAQQQAPGVAAPGVAFLKSPDPSPESVVQQQWEAMKKHMQKNQYTGALRAYEAIEDLGKHAFELAPEATPSTVHYLAATAARGLGDTERYRELLARAQAAMGGEAAPQVPGGLETVEGEMAGVEAGFGPVNIKVSKAGKNGAEAPGPQLAFTGTLLDPSALQSIKWAQGVLDEDGEFSGMLPLGSYTLGEESFTVVAGDVVKVRSRG